MCWKLNYENQTFLWAKSNSLLHNLWRQSLQDDNLRQTPCFTKVGSLCKGTCTIVGLPLSEKTEKNMTNLPKRTITSSNPSGIMSSGQMRLLFRKYWYVCKQIMHKGGAGGGTLYKIWNRAEQLMEFKFTSQCSGITFVNRKDCKLGF